MWFFYFIFRGYQKESWWRLAEKRIQSICQRFDQCTQIIAWSKGWMVSFQKKIFTRVFTLWKSLFIRNSLKRSIGHHISTFFLFKQDILLLFQQISTVPLYMIFKTIFFLLYLNWNETDFHSFLFAFYSKYFLAFLVENTQLCNLQ